MVNHDVLCFNFSDPTYCLPSSSTVFANGDLQCNYMSIADGFSSPLSKVSLAATQNTNSSIGATTCQLTPATVEDPSVPSKITSNNSQVKRCCLYIKVYVKQKLPYLNMCSVGFEVLVCCLMH
jgi:hypothetical protein